MTTGSSKTNDEAQIRRTDGEETDVWVRATIGCHKIDGKWMITHEHASVPFYMDGSYKAAVDFKP